MDAAELFEDTMESIRQEGVHVFVKEDDLVRDAQARMADKIAEDGLPYRVVREQRISGKSADLAILGADGSVLVASEFKYEPAHSRLTSTQAPRVTWSDFIKDDLGKVRGYVRQGGVSTAYSILIDEGGYWHCLYPNPPAGEWLDWGNGVWALWTKVSAGAAHQAPPAGGAPDALSSGETPPVAAPGEWVLLPRLNVNLPAYPPPPSRLRFPDDSERPVGSWKDLLFGVASWLTSVGKLTEREEPVPVDARQPQTRQRYIVSADQVHGSGKPFEEPFEIPGAPLTVETKVDKTQAKSHAIKLLEHCEVDPGSVLVR